MNSTLSFKHYLGMVEEDVNQDIATIMSKISLLDTQINSRTQPLLAQKATLQKALAIKQKEAQAQSAQNPQQGQQNGQTPGQPMQASNQTTTPGGTRTQTPGNAPSLPQ